MSVWRRLAPISAFLGAAGCLFLGCGENTVQVVRCYALAPDHGIVDAGPDAAATSDGGATPDASACAPASVAIGILLGDDDGPGEVDEGPLVEPSDGGGFLCCYLVSVKDGFLDFGP